MKRKWLAIGISTVSVILLILASLTNVVGYQSVQSLNQSVIKERINQRELLFQTIVDIANNKEIQRIILKSQISRGIFPTLEMPVLTKTQIRQMYFLGLILSKVISKTRMQSMVGKYQFNNQEIQKEISAVIEKDTILNTEITQLKNSECDCNNSDGKFYDLFCEILYELLEFTDPIMEYFTDLYVAKGGIILWIVALISLLIWFPILFLWVYLCWRVPYP